MTAVNHNAESCCVCASPYHRCTQHPERVAAARLDRKNLNHLADLLAGLRHHFLDELSNHQLFAVSSALREADAKILDELASRVERSLATKEE